MKKRILSLFIFLMLLLTSFSALGNDEDQNENNNYTSLIKITNPQVYDLPKNLEIVGGIYNQYIEVLIPFIDLKNLDDSQIEYTILIENFDEYHLSYRAQYKTFPEMETILNTTAAVYPNITSLTSIGTSYEGRDIWCLEITDNPGVDEDEPGVFFMGLHHAREWPSLATCLYLIENLTSNYGTDPEITNMINNRRIWIIPCVNPDGYVYDHDQGHDWRKNRHYFPDSGTYGVDLNRNYGGSSNGNPWGSWGSIGTGHLSHNPDNSLYCGPGQMSELETQVIRDMVIENDIHALISWHTHGELVLWPWGYSMSASAPDQAYLQSVGEEIASRITSQSGSGTYTPQQAAALYPTTGDTTDWSYGYSHYILGRPTFAYTIEECTTFHPSDSYLQQVVEENYDGAFYLLEEAENISEVIPRVAPSILDDLYFDADGDYQVSWTEKNPDANPDVFQLDELTDLQLITDDAESSSSHWNLDGFSLEDSQSHSGSYAYKSRYQDEDVSSMTSVHPLYVDMDTNLSFWCWYDIEDDYDYAFIEVSREGRYYEILDDFNGDSSGWVYKEYDLSGYRNESIYLRFRYTTDPNTQGTGFYVDDITPTPYFNSITTLSDTITNSYYDITGQPDGVYYYRVKGHNSEHNWGDFSTLEQIIVGQTNLSTHITDLNQNWNFISPPFDECYDKTNMIIKYNQQYYDWTEATTSNNPTGSPLINAYIFGWDRPNQTYTITNTINPGEGYWLFSFQECELRVSGLITDMNDIITNLKRNWNIMGTPNDESSLKTDLYVNYNDVEYIWADAITSNNPTNNPLVNDYIFGWNRNSQTYTIANTIIPGEAYWLFAYVNCTLTKSTSSTLFQIVNYPTSSEGFNWSDLASAYDNDISSYDYTETAGAFAYFNYTPPLENASQVSFYMTYSGAYANVNIDVFDGENWYDVCDQNYNNGWHTIEFPVENISLHSIRIKSSDASPTTPFNLHEIFVYTWTEDTISINPLNNETPLDDAIVFSDNPQCDVFIGNNIGNSMICNFYISLDGENWVHQQKITEVLNQTIGFDYTIAQGHNKTYFWKVTAEDQEMNKSKQFSFQMNGYIPYRSFYFNGTDPAIPESDGGSDDATLVMQLPLDIEPDFADPYSEEWFCGQFTFSVFNTSLALNESADFAIKNIYYHLWVHDDTDSPIFGNAANFGYNVQYGPSLEEINFDSEDYVTSLPSSIDPVNGFFNLSTPKIQKVSPQLSRFENTSDLIGNFTIFAVSTVPGGVFHITNLSMPSFIIVNVPDNSTLNTSYMDSDGDGLSDWSELYVNYTDPFQLDTDHDGVSDRIDPDPNDFRISYFSRN